MIELTALTPFSYQVLILIAVLVIKLLVCRFVVHEPLSFFQFYCLQLAKKVNKNSNSQQQQTIAGLLAVLVTLAPIVIILWLFADFIAVPYLWHGLLLYIALGRLDIGKISHSVAQTLINNQKHLAKQTLTPLLLRSTDPLSTMGLSKAAIEMQLLRIAQQVYAVAFIFILFGPLVALSYRLLLEMHYAWNSKLQRFKSFGSYSYQLSQLFQWLPNRLMALWFILGSVGKGALLSWRLSRSHFFTLNNNFLLSTLAFSLAVKLGGVAMYEEVKVRKVAFNDLARQPEPQDMLKAMHKINFAIYGSLFLLITAAASWQFVML